MRAVDVIRNKREGRVLQRAEIEYFVAGVTDGTRTRATPSGTEFTEFSSMH